MSACVSWESKRTRETRGVERRLRARFERVDAYRQNSASIRVRVIDPRFEGMPADRREDLVMEVLDELPEKTRADILMLLILAPSELATLSPLALSNQEFEQPALSRL